MKDYYNLKRRSRERKYIYDTSLSVEETLEKASSEMIFPSKCGSLRLFTHAGDRRSISEIRLKAEASQKTEKAI